MTSLPKRGDRVRVTEVRDNTIHPSHVEPGGGDAPLCPACGESTGLSEPCRGHSAEFAHGMRRAVEIAERISERRDWTYPPEWVARIDELKEAVEKELADG